MSTPPPAHFIGFQVPGGKTFHNAGGDFQSMDKQRPDIIRRLECYQCEFLITYNYPTDEQGNVLPKHCCKLLDLENALIEAENSKRHPTEQLLYKTCKYGDLPEPPYVPNPSDMIPR